MRGIRRRGDGLLMDLDSRHWIDWNILFRGDYEPRLTRLWDRLAPLDGVAVDVGANVGSHTLTMAQRVGTGGRVLAFEPNPLVRATLERNVALNGFPQVRVFDCALGDAAGSLPLRVPKKDTPEFSHIGLASLVALDTPHDLVDVPVRPLDDVLTALAITRVDVVKIDVQGYEVATLRGMRACLQRCRPTVVLEYDAWAWERAGVGMPDAVTLLEEAGYGVFRLDDAGREGTLPIARGDRVPDFADVLALPQPPAPARA